MENVFTTENLKENFGDLLALSLFISKKVKENGIEMVLFPCAGASVNVLTEKGEKRAFYYISQKKIRSPDLF
jgi:hypothetical protein